MCTLKLNPSFYNNYFNFVLNETIHQPYYLAAPALADGKTPRGIKNSRAPIFCVQILQTENNLLCSPLICLRIKNIDLKLTLSLPVILMYVCLTPMRISPNLGHLQEHLRTTY